MIDGILQLLGLLPLWAWKVLPCFLAVSVAVSARRGRRIETAFALLLLVVWSLSRLVRLNVGDEWQWAFKALIDLGAGGAFGIIALRTFDFRAWLIAALCAVQVILHCAYAIHLITEQSSDQAKDVHYWLSFFVAWAEALAFSRGVYGGRKRGHGYRGDHWGDHLSWSGRGADQGAAAAMGEVGPRGRGVSDA